jgi:hypothetical protein
MKAKPEGYPTSLKLFLGIFLAICALATTAYARPFYTGTFKLTTQVHWSNRVLDPGTYSVTLSQVGESTRTITIREMPSGKVILSEVTPMDTDVDTTDSKIFISTHGTRRSVVSVKLAGIGEVYGRSIHDTESRGAAQEAAKVETIPVQWASN